MVLMMECKSILAHSEKPVLVLYGLSGCTENDLLRQRNELLDIEIAKSTDFPLAVVRQHISDLEAKGAVRACHLIRYNGKEKFEGLVCRIAGFIPEPKPGKKSQ